MANRRRAPWANARATRVTRFNAAGVAVVTPTSTRL